MVIGCVGWRVPGCWASVSEQLPGCFPTVFHQAPGDDLFHASSLPRLSGRRHLQSLSLIV